MDRTLLTIEQKDAEGLRMREQLLRAQTEDELYDEWTALMLEQDRPEIWQKAEDIVNPLLGELTGRQYHFLKVLGWYGPLRLPGIRNMTQGKLTADQIAMVMMVLEGKRLIRTKTVGVWTEWRVAPEGVRVLGKDYSPKPQRVIEAAKGGG